MSQVRQHGGKTMVVEELDVEDAEDLLEENEDIKIVVPSFCASKAFRLSFYTKAFKTERGLASVSSEEVIGYVIVKVDEIPEGVDCNRTRVYESVIRRSSQINNFVRGAQQWAFSAAGKPMHIDGFLYAQQNALTNCCAHAALRTVAARFHKQGDMTYREMNRLTGIKKDEIPGLSKDIPPLDHVKRKVGDAVDGGLLPLEMMRILEAAGAQCFIMEYVELTDPPAPPFGKYLYGSLESGYPAIVGFESAPEQHHAIPVFGHTFNEDTWAPTAERAYFKIGPGTEYIPSESWLSNFIGHDDNLGSNFCIPRHFLQTRPACDKLEAANVVLCKRESRCVSYVIGTFPDGVRVDSCEAELMGVDYLRPLLEQLPEQDQDWSKRLHRYFAGRFSVFRPLLIDPDDYIRHLELVRDWRDERIAEDHIENLRNEFQGTEKLWMIELSIPELFSANKRKIAEVLVRAEREYDPGRRFDNFLLARLPGWFAFLKKVDDSGPEFMFRSSVVTEHVELYGCEESRDSLR